MTYYNWGCIYSSEPIYTPANQSAVPATTSEPNLRMTEYTELLNLANRLTEYPEPNYHLTECTELLELANQMTEYSER